MAFNIPKLGGQPGLDDIQNPPLRGATSNPGEPAVLGVNHKGGFGLLGGKDFVFRQQVGVFGQSEQQGVHGHGTIDTGTGVLGTSARRGFGVRGETVDGIALQGQSFGSGLAGKFIGNVAITGTLTAFVDIVLQNGDCAEEFDIEGDAKIDPGTVMILRESGAVQPSAEPYDKRAIGIVSGAGIYRPALVLDKRITGRKRLPLGLVGKVFCKVEARHAPIHAGDLLTTSSIPGHAMKADDPVRGFGAILGKALASLDEGLGLISVLVSLR